MVSSYTANLAAFLTVETLVTPFGNIEELALQKNIRYGAKAGGATYNFFRVRYIFLLVLNYIKHRQTRYNKS